MELKTGLNFMGIAVNHSPDGRYIDALNYNSHYKAGKPLEMVSHEHTKLLFKEKSLNRLADHGTSFPSHMTLTCLHWFISIRVLPRKKVAWYQCIILRGGGWGALESPPPPRIKKLP